MPVSAAALTQQSAFPSLPSFLASVSQSRQAADAALVQHAAPPAAEPLSLATPPAVNTSGPASQQAGGQRLQHSPMPPPLQPAAATISVSSSSHSVALQPSITPPACLSLAGEEQRVIRSIRACLSASISALRWSLRRATMRRWRSSWMTARSSSLSSVGRQRSGQTRQRASIHLHPHQPTAARLRQQLQQRQQLRQQRPPPPARHCLRLRLPRRDALLVPLRSLQPHLPPQSELSATRCRAAAAQPVSSTMIPATSTRSSRQPR